MPFTGNENHSISLLEAAQLTAKYRASHPTAIKGFYFSKTAIKNILSQPECLGIRIYFGEDDTNNPKLLIAGVEANEDDISAGLIAEFGLACPLNCGIPNALNS